MFFSSSLRSAAQQEWGFFCCGFGGGFDKYFTNPKDPLVCPENPGFPLTNHTTWGWDFSTIDPTNFREGSDKFFVQREGAKYSKKYSIYPEEPNRI